MTNRLLIGLLTFFTGVPLVTAAPPDPLTDHGIALFEAKIRPVLAEHCYQCHSASTGKTESSLALDSKQGVLSGGDRGPAVVPKDPEASLLLRAISQVDEDLQMPPRGKPLPAPVIAAFKSWIELGAPDPRVETASKIPEVDFEAGRKFWAFQKPRQDDPPAVKDESWPRRDLDRYVLGRLEANGLAPTADAELRVLLRRLYFDLIGLPPTPQQMLRFESQVQSVGLDSAIATATEGLLASEQFGERWGRHWLDVARFAESSGKDTNVTFPHAWRYRDYVIDALNADKPYDRFISEQIAGDLLPYADDQQRAELLIATGFLALGPKGLNEMNRLQFVADVIDEQIDTVTRAVMASSVACARCHDHKFDPYSMTDYYALAGIFGSSKSHYGTSVAPGNQVGGDLLTLPSLSGQLIPNRSLPPKQFARLQKDLADLRQEEKDRKAAARQAILEGRDPTEFFGLADALRILWRSGGIEGKLKTVDGQGRALPLAMGMADRATIQDAPLLVRGEIARPADRVPRGFPRVIDLPHQHKVPHHQSGRDQLARWLVDPAHPLTARVWVNRIWHHLMGAGIVRTVDNFGSQGEPPSHPALLDHLALKLISSGWSTKAVLREIVLSRTYRQASTFSEPAFQVDPENRLLWRAHQRRLDAEAIRDAMLSVSGRLDLHRPGGSLIATIGDRPVSIIAFDKRVPADLDGSSHRSVYLPVVRDRLPDVLELFDFAEPSLVTGHRETTNVPLQALYLLNSPFVQQQAAGLASRLELASPEPDDQVRLAYQLCYGRLPDLEEKKLASEFLRQPVDTHQTDSPQPSQLQLYCQSLLATAEFRSVE